MSDGFDATPWEGGPLLVVLSGPSGVGKDSVLAAMRLTDPRPYYVVTATTRPRRPGEVDGHDYLFISPGRFQKMVDQGEFLEHAEVYGRRYGVPRPPVREALARGQDVIVKTDVQGAATIKGAAPEAVLVFLAPPSLEELERRLRSRQTDSPEQVKLRIQTARRELEQLANFDYVVVNHRDGIPETVARLQAVVAAERCRVPPRRVSV